MNAKRLCILIFILIIQSNKYSFSQSVPFQITINEDFKGDPGCQYIQVDNFGKSNINIYREIDIYPTQYSNSDSFYILVSFFYANLSYGPKILSTGNNSINIGGEKDDQNLGRLLFQNGLEIELSYQDILLGICNKKLTAKIEYFLFNNSGQDSLLAIRYQYFCFISCPSDFSESTTNIDVNRQKHLTNLDTKFNIYPNPFSDKITISFEGKLNSSFEVRIYNLRGELLSKSFLNTDFLSSQWNNFKIDLSNLPKGLFLIRIENEQSKITRLLSKF